MGNILYIDFETRSRADLKAVGAHRYCCDSSTEVLLMSYAFNDEPVQVTEFGDLPERVYNALEDVGVLKVAHNAEFDMCVCKYLLGIQIDVDCWHDTAFQAAYYSHPRALAKLSLALRCTSKASQDELHFFSFPVKEKKRKGVVPPSFFNEPSEHKEMWQGFKRYAAGDIIAMREVYKKMATLPSTERATMSATFEMNFNGVPFDAPLAVSIYEASVRYSEEAGRIALDKYGVVNLRSGLQVKEALSCEGVDLPSLDKKERGGVSHELLVLRDQATGSAFSKLPKALQRLCPDQRLHGEFVGNGAHTGRWSSRGVQLQNFARILSEVSTDLANIRDYDHLRQHLRLCIHAPRGYDFVCADESQIEARIIAWLSGCKWRMDAFENGDDIYARSAEKMFGLPKVTKSDPERQHGKCAELGFGFGGGKAAIERIVPDFYREQGEAKVQKLVDLWRAANPEICELWRKLENAFRSAMSTGACRLYAGGALLTFRFDGSTLAIGLPSGRSLYYRGVRLTPANYAEELTYTDYSRNGDPQTVKLWGGVLAENVTQAIAKDVLLDVMVRVKGWDSHLQLIGTVHDEVWYLSKTGEQTLQLVLDEMARPIVWAEGLLTKGDGFYGERYIK